MAKISDCNKDVCLNNCDRLAECDPGGFGKEYVEKTKCPLNVCCSKHGFCGSTEEFCGNKKVTPRTCSDHVLERVVGYYEGWATRRPCNAFMPEQIPIGVYTHINFAFATIDPVTFEVRPASSADTKLYKRVASLKQRDPDLKVLIAIGGWTFNDPGPTATTFSDIARSESAQKAFFKSLISMMSTYDFDGVDLDWEYPVAEDRSGREEDFENFPKFLANLKKALKSTGGRNEGICSTLTFMSYDLHGTWDKTNKWVGPYLNAHTNLTEIEEAMNLLWRNDIDPNKIVLGTGFYGRAFTATSPNCLSPGCTYESGAPRQPCSNEISVMLQSEIVDVMKRTGNKPVLDKEAAVKILTFDSNQWVAYDDEDTFQMKADFARKYCMSGIMVWAISGDVSDGTYSKAIRKAAARKFTSIPAEFWEKEDDGLLTTVTKHPQCKWTNCGESCPSNWIRMTRNDKEARKNEYMVDGSYCSEGVHELCCPPGGDTPTCGWYQHNNGKCNPTCPVGTLEVGSLKKHCNNGKYQAACCTTGGKSMDLYNQCSWTEAPMCMNGQCSGSAKEVARSPTGSGTAVCNVEEWTRESVKIQERKYCCIQETNKMWDGCAWYDNLGPGKDDEYYCRSGCPSDRVRVAMDGNWNQDGKLLCQRGARAKCCIPNHSTITKRESSQDEVLRDALESFLESPVCSENGVGFRLLPGDAMLGRNTSEPKPRTESKAKRSLSHVQAHSSGSGSRPNHHHPHPHSGSHRGADTSRSSLQSRQESWGNYQQDEIKKLVYTLLLGTATLNQKEIWDALVPKRYSNLKWDNLEDWIVDEEAIIHYGYDQLAFQITCHMGYFNDQVGGKVEHGCQCDTDACCPGGGDWCALEEADVEMDEALSAFAGDDDEFSLMARPRPGEKRSYTITFPDGTTIEIESEPYYPASHSFWHANHPIWNNVHLYPQSDCLDVNPRIVRYQKGRPGVHLEHIIEMNTISRFFTHALAGTLPSGRPMRSGRISDSLVRRTLQGRYSTMPPQMPGGGNSDNPIQRIFNAIGSQANNQHMVITSGGLNMAKSAFWTQDTRGYKFGTTWMHTDNMNRAMQSIRAYETFVEHLRNPIIAINYLADPTIWGYLLTMVNDVANELRLLQDFHRAQTGISDDLVGAWHEFIRDLLQTTVDTARDWVQGWVITARNEYRDENGEDVINLLAMLSTLLRYAFELELPLHQLP
ncbi:Killer toxin subunits alpha/beta 4 [Colletotrichum kahawae]|uniref:chitinase n=1 Tax=Colletotrichum kahawae TaxID=34407 RepID=A0AAD9Y6N0_COLKA|nr:Killer toxin subunits alpha/beta 4 [Colletotrichum kahawae]